MLVSQAPGLARIQCTLLSLLRLVNTSHLSFQRKRESSDFTGCRIKSGMTGFDDLVAGLMHAVDSPFLAG